jgi:hypothetical protein
MELIHVEEDCEIIMNENEFALEEGIEEKRFVRYLRHFQVHNQKMTHSQLLERLKCESQIENNRRVRNRGTFLGSQHFGGVEGHAGTPRWD